MGPIKIYSSIGLNNGLSPTGRQAIIWTNDGKITIAYMHHSASMTWNVVSPDRSCRARGRKVLS